MIYGTRTSGGEHGTVYTNVEVVNFILSIAGLNTLADLLTKKVLDPAVGEGAFVIPLIRKIIDLSGTDVSIIIKALKNITVVELDPQKIEKLKNNISSELRTHSVDYEDFLKYINIINDDYLLAKTDRYDVIIGNPPYVRYDNIPVEKVEIYKRLFSCFKNRSDLYILFIEKGIKSLNENGILSFICADRWLNNQYGISLKKTIYHNFFLKDFVKIDNFSPFSEEVIAYPAIFSIANMQKSKSFYYTARSKEDLDYNLYSLNKSSITFDENGNFIFNTVNPTHTRIEEQGFKIGIGVATGADKVFIINGNQINLEKEVLVPLITRKDVDETGIVWNGRYVINPFYNNTSSLIDLERYPNVKKYLQDHYPELNKRHVAEKNIKNWYKTIDRIDINLLHKPKLLIPDISTKNIIYFDKGDYYPHHNFYYITGNTEDELLILRAILSSNFVKQQIAEKGLLMNGGALRWQAQTLRKVYIPNISLMSDEQKKEILNAYESGLTELNNIIFKLVA
jgi:methylase of polypeptide subunit release factors